MARGRVDIAVPMVQCQELIGRCLIAEVRLTRSVRLGEHCTVSALHTLAQPSCN